MIGMTVLAYLAESAPGDNPPLVDSSTALIVTTIVTVVGGGIFAILLKRAKGPAEVLEQQVAADEAAARKIEAERKALEAKEQGFKQAAEFIKQSAEASIRMYQEQSVELRSTIAVLTESIESQQKLAAAQRDMSEEERTMSARTIQRLRDRIKALEGQLKALLEHVRVQQLKIDLLEGRAPVDVSSDSETFPTLSRAELATLNDALHPSTEEIAV